MPENTDANSNFRPLSTTSLLQCPHGGNVRITPTRKRPVDPGPGMIVTANDIFQVCGCPFSTPTGPSPCQRVTWLVSNSDRQVDGENTLNYASIGSCITQKGTPQGPVLIVSDR